MTYEEAMRSPLYTQLPDEDTWTGYQARLESYDEHGPVHWLYERNRFARIGREVQVIVPDIVPPPTTTPGDGHEDDIAAAAYKGSLFIAGTDSDETGGIRHEAALYDADGRQLWSKDFTGVIDDICRRISPEQDCRHLHVMAVSHAGGRAFVILHAFADDPNEELIGLIEFDVSDGMASEVPVGSEFGGLFKPYPGASACLETADVVEDDRGIGLVTLGLTDDEADSGLISTLRLPLGGGDSGPTELWEGPEDAWMVSARETASADTRAPGEWTFMLQITTYEDDTSSGQDRLILAQEDGVRVDDFDGLTPLWIGGREELLLGCRESETAPCTSLALLSAEGVLVHETPWVEGPGDDIRSGPRGGFRRHGLSVEGILQMEPSTGAAYLASWEVAVVGVEGGM